MENMEQAIINRINDCTFRFTESALGADVYMYLLIGSEKALLIDTGYGFTDVPSEIRKLTDLPLTVINTHGHLDHVHGNHLYDEVLLSDDDIEVFNRHTDETFLRSLMELVATANGLPLEMLDDPALKIKEIIKSLPSRHVPLPESIYIELGNRKVRILQTPGHTAGSICLLDENNGWLFAGDMICRDGVLLNFPESTTVETYVRSISMLKDLADKEQITTIFPGHQITPLDVSFIDLCLRICDDILNGRISGEEKEKGIHCIDNLTISFDPAGIWKEE